jgi:Flp pilus assembly protein TadG
MGISMRTFRQFRSRGRSHDRGLITLELLIVFPMLFLLLMGIVQAALFYFAQQAALAAAEQGVRVAAVSGSTQDPFSGANQGAVAAQEFITSHAGNVLTATATATPVPATDEIQITVTGQAFTLVPGFSLGISQTAVGSVEKFSSRWNP